MSNSSLAIKADAKTETCSGCGTAVATSNVVYNAMAQVLCPGCAAKAEIVRDEGRAAGNLKAAGWSAVGTGVLAFIGPIAMLGVITYFFAATSMISAIVVINGLSRGNERFTKYLSTGQRSIAWTCAIVGITLSALGVLGVPLLFMPH
jgi:hypothetical protein